MFRCGAATPPTYNFDSIFFTQSSSPRHARRAFNQLLVFGTLNEFVNCPFEQTTHGNLTQTRYALKGRVTLVIKLDWRTHTLLFLAK
jgi:hypothetical protein